MPIPALIEYEGVVHFSLIRKDGFNLVCPVSIADRKIRQIGTPAPPLPPKGYHLLACGKLVEDTMRATGQWEAILIFMSDQMLTAVRTRTPGLRRKYAKWQAMAKHWPYGEFSS